MTEFWTATDKMKLYDKATRADDIYCDFLDAALEIKFPELMERIKNESLDPDVDWQVKSDLSWRKLKAGDELKSDGTFDLTQMQIRSWSLAGQNEQAIENAIEEYRQSLVQKS